MGKLKALFSKVFSGIGGFVKKHKIWSAIIILVIIIALVLALIPGKKNNKSAVKFNEVTVSRQNIASTVTGNSIVEANAEYSITPLVTGEILEAPFEEGDKVEKGQVMYKIDAETMENSLSSSNISIQKAQKNYNDAVQDITDLSVRSTLSGRVSAVYVKKGDNVNNGTKIADVISDSKMEIRIPFNASDISSIHNGMGATLTLVGNGTQLNGTVTAVGRATEATSGYMQVCYVTIVVDNPGALTSGDSATAMIGDIACNDIGKFEPVDTTTILAKVSGTIARLNINQGDKVAVGEVVAQLTSDSVDSQLTNATFSLQEAELSRDRLLKQLDDYTITAPIEGTVVKKNKKAGEKIESGGGGNSSASSSSNSNVLAVIYDMSSLCFQLDVDEMDVKKISVGQEVIITADAVEGTTYNGVVENVSVNGTIGTNGVTTYPVKVRIQDFDENLLPGMNIEATISVNTASNAIAIPLTAINRGNIVYVKGEKTDEKDRAPEGFKTVMVETGISNDSFIEIVSGLNEGDVIYVPVIEIQQTQFTFPGMGHMSGGMSGGRMPSGGMTGGRMPSGGMSSGRMPSGGMR